MIIAVATFVMAITAVITSVLTWGLFRENRFLRKAGTEPQVVACLMIDPRYGTSLNFVLVNVGQGPALNISFSIECDETDFLSHEVQLRNRSSQSPIGLLTQGGQVATYFGGHSLFGEHRLRPFTVNVRYDDIKGRKCSSTSTLDVSQFEGFGVLGSPPEHEMAEALKKIEKHLSTFSFGSSRRL
ncbi:MAG: hypothetical protein Q8L63_00700, partial [Alphaproteobacteria bacterium]|nr:hypothetical protein [Alphaproteobacteria bacterium]